MPPSLFWLFALLRMPHVQFYTYSPVPRPSRNRPIPYMHERHKELKYGSNCDKRHGGNERTTTSTALTSTRTQPSILTVCIRGGWNRALSCVRGEWEAEVPRWIHYAWDATVILRGDHLLHPQNRKNGRSLRLTPGRSSSPPHYPSIR